MKKYVAVAVLLLSSVSFVRGQDPQFTQFFANPLYIAPSYAGASQGHRAVLSYRDQWSMVPNMYRQLSVSYDVNIASLRSGFGIFALGDLAGDGLLGVLILSGDDFDLEFPSRHRFVLHAEGGQL